MRPRGVQRGEPLSARNDRSRTGHDARRPCSSPKLGMVHAQAKGTEKQADQDR